MPCTEEFVGVPPETRVSSYYNKLDKDGPAGSQSYCAVEPKRSLIFNEPATMFINPQINGQSHHQKTCRSSDVEPEHGADGKMNGEPGPAGDSSDPMNPRVVLYPPNRIKLHWNMHKIGAGLNNLGNSCYINSVLQSLTHTPPLVNYCLSDDHPSQCKQKKFCLMCQLVFHIRRSLLKDLQVIPPYWVKQKSEDNPVAKSFPTNVQEDAHEFLRVMVEGMQKACLNACLNGYTKLDQISRDTTVVNQIFGGYLQSQVRCMKCSARFNKYDPYMDICLEIKGLQHLEEAFARYIKPEILDIDNAYKCERCLQKVNAEKRLTIFKEPNVLTIQLKRFDFYHHTSKIKGHIGFEDRLNLRPFMSQTQGEDLWYRLYSVLVHVGNHTHGHYYSYIKASDSTWYLMNDMEVKRVPSSIVFSDDAYVLFYLRDVGRQHNQFHKNTPPNNAWEPSMRFNGGGSRHNGPVSSPLNAGPSGRYNNSHGNPVNGAVGRCTSMSSPVNGGPTGRYAPHGSQMNGEAGSHHGPHFAPVKGIGPRHSTPGRMTIGDRGDYGVSRSQPGDSPRPPPQPAPNMGTPLPMEHKKISFDFNNKRPNQSRPFGPQPKPNNYHVNGFPKVPHPKPTTEPHVNSAPNVPQTEQSSDTNGNGEPKVRIVLTISNGTMTTCEKISDGKESVVKSYKSRKVPSKLVPYELDSDSEESTSKRTDRDSGMDLPHRRDQESNDTSSYAHDGTRLQTGYDGSTSNHIDCRSEGEREKVCGNAESFADNSEHQKTSFAGNSDHTSLTKSAGVHGSSADVHSRKSGNALYSSQDLYFGSASVHRNKRARAGSIDRISSTVKPLQKRSSSLEPVQRHSFEQTVDADLFASYRQESAYNEQSSQESVSNQDAQQADHQQANHHQVDAEADRLNHDHQYSGERHHKKKKKKKHRKNRDRYNEGDSDGYRHYARKVDREHDYSSRSYKDRWGKQQETEYKRQSEMSYSDYDHQSSSAKRARSTGSSESSEYEWAERTKESLQIEESSREKSQVRYNGRDGDWGHSSMKTDDRYSNGTSWSHSHTDQRWKKGAKQWRHENNHHVSSRDRWRDDPHSQSSYHSSYNTPSSLSRARSSDHQSGYYHPRNSGSSSSSSSHHSYYRDHHHSHHNGFDSGSHHSSSRRSYGYQRHY